MTPDDLLNELEATGALEARPDLLRWSLVAAARLLSSKLPPTVVAALDTAERHLRGTATDTELEAARVHSWHLADTPGGQVTDPDVAAIRAAICALYPEIDDPFETTRFFFSMSVLCDGPVAQQLALLESLKSQIEDSD